MKPRKCITGKQFSKRLEREVITWEMRHKDLLLGCFRDASNQPRPRVRAELADMDAYINAVKRLEHRWHLGEEPNDLITAWAQFRKHYGADRMAIAIGKWRIPIPHRDPTAIVVVDAAAS